MRRGRIIGVFAGLVAALGVGFAAAPGVASAATPADICRAIGNGTFNPTNYSTADIAAYLTALSSDPTIQGYCSPIVVVTAATCVEVPAGTPGAVLGANGKYYTNAPNGNGAGCGTPPTASCVEVPANTPGAVKASNGTWYANAPNGKAEACAPSTVTVALAPVPTSGVKGATKVKPAPQTIAAPAKHAAAPAQHAAAPLATTKSAGALPFTGAELAIFAVVGLALLGGGLALRMTARHRRPGG
jgi:hypothetical protein